MAEIELKDLKLAKVNFTGKDGELHVQIQLEGKGLAAEAALSLAGYTDQKMPVTFTPEQLPLDFKGEVESELSARGMKFQRAV